MIYAGSAGMEEISCTALARRSGHSSSGASDAAGVLLSTCLEGALSAHTIAGLHLPTRNLPESAAPGVAGIACELHLALIRFGGSEPENIVIRGYRY